LARSSPVYLGIIQSQTEEHSKKLLRDKIKVLWEKLPHWFKWMATNGRVDEVTFTTLEMRFPDGQTIMCVPQGSHQFRQHTPSTIFVDEAAHQDQFGDTLTSVIPFLEKDTKMFFVSSVRGGSIFSEVLSNSKVEGGVEKLLEGSESLPAHRRKGMQAWRMETGGEVLQIHYSVVPGRDMEWVESTAKDVVGGVEAPSWRQEFEIEYNAFSGQRVFPLFGSSMVREFEPPDGGTAWLGGDYGRRNPTAIVDIRKLADTPAGPHYGAFRELYQKDCSIADLKRMMWIAFGAPENYEAELIDPSTDSVRESDTDTHFHLFNTGEYARAFQKANNSFSGLVVLNEWLEQGRLWVHPQCQNLIYELEHYVYPDWVNKRVKEVRNEKESPVKKNDHAVDALRYVANYLSLRENTLDDADNPERWLPPEFMVSSRERYMGHGRRLTVGSSIFD
jgi:hypothetical protein